MVSRRSINGFALVPWLLIRPLCVGLRHCVALKWRPVTVALPVAATATAATPAATPPTFAGLAFGELGAFLLLCRGIVFRQAAVMIFVHDRMLGDGVVRE